MSMVNGWSIQFKLIKAILYQVGARWCYAGRLLETWWQDVGRQVGPGPQRVLVQPVSDLVHWLRLKVTLTHWLWLKVTLTHWLRLKMTLTHWLWLKVTLVHWLRLKVTLAHCLKVTLAHCLKVTLVHCLKVTLAHCLKVTLAHWLKVTLAHWLKVTLVHWLSGVWRSILSKCISIFKTIYSSHPIVYINKCISVCHKYTVGRVCIFCFFSWNDYSTYPVLFCYSSSALKISNGYLNTCDSCPSCEPWAVWFCYGYGGFIMRAV